MICSINQNWKFIRCEGLLSFEDLPETLAGTALPVEGFLEVDLPHTWYEENGEAPYRGLALYRKTVRRPEDWEELYLSFPAADQYARVYVNSFLAGAHKGGYGAFCVRVPEAAIKGEELDICVLVTNEANDRISPLMGDFTVFGGLYRGVDLILSHRTHFDYMYCGTMGVIPETFVDARGNGAVFAETHIVAGDADNVRVVYELLDAEGRCAARQEKKIKDRGMVSFTEALAAEKPQLWEGRENPYLYCLRASLYADGECVDTVEKRTGFCSWRADPDRGLFLNGKPFRVKGVALHQDTAGRYCARTEQDSCRDLELVNEIGADAVRLSHYQHPQFTYDKCDEQGLAVWAEIPMLKLTENTELFENARDQLRELILQNKHHPAIFCWGIQNEIALFGEKPFMAPKIKELYDLAKDLDKRRLVSSANLYSVTPESRLNDVTDLTGYNLYFGWYYGGMTDFDEYLDRLHETCPRMPFGLSEYGVDANIRVHSETPVKRDYSEEYQALFHQTVYPIFERKTWLWGSFVWNMFDFCSAHRREGGIPARNGKGLVTYDRKEKKDSFYYYKAKWSEEPFLHLCGKRFRERTLPEISLKVYTNQPETSLEVNSRRLGTEKNDGNGTVCFAKIPLEYGENRVTVRCGELQDTAVFLRTDTPVETYRLPEEKEEADVKNWFLD